MKLVVSVINWGKQSNQGKTLKLKSCKGRMNIKQILPVKSNPGSHSCWLEYVGVQWQSGWGQAFSFMLPIIGGCLLFLIGSEFLTSSALWKVGDTRHRRSLGFVYFALVRFKQWPHRATFSVSSTSAVQQVDAAASRSVFLQACRSGLEEEEEKKIN